MSLASLSNVKEKLDLGSDNSEDDLINLLIGEVDSFFEGWSGGRIIEQASYVDYYDGDGRAFLYLDQRPVTSITNVWVDQDGYYGQAAGGFADGDLWASGVDYALKRTDESEKNRGLIVALKWKEFDNEFGIWPRGTGNIKVSYTAGYTTVPAALMGAAESLVIRMMNEIESGGLPINSEKIGDYAYSLMTQAAGDAQIDIVRSTFNKYSLKVAG